TLVVLPCTVPEFSVNPGDAGDEAVGFDGAKNCAGVGIDLMDLAVRILAYPQRPFGPREPRVTAAGSRNGGQHAAGLGINLLDAIARELKQVLAVKGRSCIRDDIDRAQRLAARWIERVQLVPRSKPDVLTIVCDSSDMVRIGERAVLTDDFGG